MIGYRIWIIAKNCFKEVIRDRLPYFLIFFALLLGIGMRLLPYLSANTQDKMLLDLGMALISIFAALIAILVGTNLINKEIEKKTILVLIPKPVSRLEFIVGKHAGLSALMALMVAAMTVIFFIFLWFAKISFPIGALIVSIIYLMIEVKLLIALSMAFGVFTSSLLATLFSLGVYLMGHISRDLVDLARISDNPGVKLITESLYLVLPDLARLDLKNEAVYGILPSLGELIGNAIYGGIYAVALLAIAVLLFSRRQF
jgi:ABC-type transport system involved in multi-copper enzyme maturation permease subunit